MSDIQVYDDEAMRLQAAFEGFKTVYTTMHTPPQEMDTRQFWMSFKTVAILFGLIGAVVVSASHTVPVLVGVESIMDIGIGIEFVIGVASFVMIEIMAIVFAYNAIETETANQDMIKRVNRNMKLGKWFIVAIMVIFNIYYVLTSNGIPLYEWMRITIFLFIGTSAPVVAFLTGEIWAIDKIKHGSKMRRENEAYQTAYSEWEIGLINSWNAQKKKWGGQVSIQVEPVQQSQTVSDSPQLSLPSGQSQTVSDSRRKSLSQKMVVAWIDKNGNQWMDVVEPTMTQVEKCEAISELIIGDSTGYKTVERAFKKMKIEL